MTKDIHTEHTETLGEHLRRLRLEQNCEIEEVLSETKIPSRAFRAMEADDYSSLPADAFARGFYRLYANFLEIDHVEILKRYERERSEQPGKSGFSSPSRQEKQVNTMAARPSMATGATLGFSLVVVIAFLSLVSWYFSWNPATFLSEKLRSLQKEEISQMEQNGSTAERPSQLENQTEPGDTSKNYLTIEFLEDTTITIAIDNRSPEEQFYSKGATHSWYATTTISVILPESNKTNLNFNGSRIEAPKAQNGLVSIILP